MTFSFKGETCELDAAIDLDRCLGEPGATPDVHRLLARAAGIDPDSYLLAGPESHEIGLSDATVVAARSCRDGRFTWDADPALKAALPAASRAGKADG